MERCSGIIEAVTGIDYCYKEVNKEDAIFVSWVQSKMMHNIYFCSFKCLSTFIKYSFWEDR